MFVYNFPGIPRLQDVLATSGVKRNGSHELRTEQRRRVEHCALQCIDAICNQYKADNKQRSFSIYIHDIIPAAAAVLPLMPAVTQCLQAYGFEQTLHEADKVQYTIADRSKFLALPAIVAQHNEALDKLKSSLTFTSTRHSSVLKLLSDFRKKFYKDEPIDQQVWDSQLVLKSCSAEVLQKVAISYAWDQSKLSFSLPFEQAFTRRGVAKFLLSAIDMYAREYGVILRILTANILQCDIVDQNNFLKFLQVLYPNSEMSIRHVAAPFPVTDDWPIASSPPTFIPKELPGLFSNDFEQLFAKLPETNDRLDTVLAPSSPSLVGAKRKHPNPNLSGQAKKK